MPTQVLKAISKPTPKPLNRVHAVLGAAALLLLVIWVVKGSGDITLFIDQSSMLIVLWVLAGGLWMGFGPRVAASAIGKALVGYRETDALKLSTYIAVLARARQLCWGAGAFGVLAGVVMIGSYIEEDPAALGPATAVCVLPALYAAILAEFVFGPLQQVMLSRANRSADMTPNGS